MDGQFGFLSAGGAFAAQLPDGIDPSPELYGVVVLDGSPRSLTFRPVARFDVAHPEQVYLFDKQSSIGPVAVYERPDEPALVFLYWTFPQGFLWTHLEMDNSWSTNINTLLRGFVAFEDGLGMVRTRVSSPLSIGNIRNPDERDAAIYYNYSDQPPLWSLVFSYSGALGVDQQGASGGASFATVTTELGVSVSANGPAGNEKALLATASEVASTVSVVSLAGV